MRCTSTEARRDEWTELLEASSADFAFSQTWAFGEAVARAYPEYRYEPRRVAFGDGLTLLMPLVRVRRRPALLRWFEAMPFSLCGTPLALGGAASAEHLGAAVDALSAHHLLLNGGADVPLNLLLPGLVATEVSTEVLDLSGGFEAVWNSRFSGKVRNQCRMAERAGVEVARGHAPVDVEAYVDLYRESTRRWGYAQPPYPTAVFHALVAAGAELKLARREGRVVAGALFFPGRRSTLYWGSATRREEARHAPLNAVLRQAIEEACQRGHRRFDFGVSGPLESVRRYKRSFGAQPATYRNYLGTSLLDGAVGRLRRWRDRSAGQAGVTSTPGGLRLCLLADPRSIHTLRWIEYFRRRGHAIALISAAEPPAASVDAYFPLRERSAVPGTRLLLNVHEARRSLRLFRPHLLHAHYINENGWLGASSGFHPFVLSAWGSDVFEAPHQSRLARLLTPWSVRRADFVLADSYDQLRVLRTMGARPEDTERVTWGIDFDEFDGAGGAEWRRARGIAPGAVVILSPRQWLPGSNIDVILEAFARLASPPPAPVLVLRRWATSTVDQRRAVESRLRELGLIERAVLVDDVPAAELPRLYAAADVTVSLRSPDGTPMSVLEAMASGSVVVAAAVPSLAEWVHDGSGILVPPRDPAVLAAALQSLVDDPSRRRALAAGGLQIVRDQADRGRNLQRVEERYRTLVAHHRSGLVSAASERADP